MLILNNFISAKVSIPVSPPLHPLSPQELTKCSNTSELAELALVCTLQAVKRAEGLPFETPGEPSQTLRFFRVCIDQVTRDYIFGEIT